MELTLTEIAELVNGEVVGDGSVIITGVGKIEDALPGQITFISNPKYVKFIDSTKASAVLVGEDFPQVSIPVVRTKNAYFSFLKLLRYFNPPIETLEEGIHPSAVIHETATIGANTRIGAGVVIGKSSRIGENSTIYPGVVIGVDVVVGSNTVLHANVVLRERVKVGSKVILHSGVVVGSDGFGFAREGETYHKIPQVGIVIIEDDVEIGSNCSIDRATLGATIIRKGVKLDNLIQVAHNVEIGENTVIAAQTGISGSTKLGRNMMIGGQVGFTGHIEVGDRVTVAAQSGVSKYFPPDSVVFGYPARPIMQAKRQEAALRRLPGLLKRISELESKLAAFEKK
ncbi:UDP-3-O-(3-hydroxymyristoyl)glucosamine N-acyltransferase [candidate division KSB1 bacterium]|nr:UDP-3-O-(3-hydroxymyristoyl)glucosamine N-acyltransferase [candidate division KSB1 bacterium]MBL7093445.1 UDP-3-O-(3-hydroxymyristoyl)glucosamine N-acyltransferase [candidate division KSB1 bacterium]